MNVLTDEEIDASLKKDGVRGVEAAVIRKLSAGVSVAPAYFSVTGPYERIAFAAQDSAQSYCNGLNRGFGEDAYAVGGLLTLDQLNTALAAARVQAIQDCDDAVSELSHDASRGDCGQAIRALLGKEAT